MVPPMAVGFRSVVLSGFVEVRRGAVGGAIWFKLEVEPAVVLDVEPKEFGRFFSPAAAA